MKKINVLQSFRAIFIVLICIEHMALNNKLSLLGAGGEGVAFFIVLSGFLVGYLYRERSIDASFLGSEKIFGQENKEILSFAYYSVIFIGFIANTIFS